MYYREDKKEGWTHVEVAHLLGITNKLSSQLFQAQMDSFNLEMLLVFAVKMSLTPTLTLNTAP